MATETLRPNGAGDETNLAIAGSSPAATNWQSVDEAVADDSVTIVRTPGGGFDDLRDLYNLADSGVGTGEINKITVYTRVRVISDNGGAAANMYNTIKSGTGSGAPDTIGESGVHTWLTTVTWQDFSDEWATNPATAAAWTWDEIDKLQAGIRLVAPVVRWVECTQVYVEVDYTPGPVEQAVGGGTIASAGLLGRLIKVAPGGGAVGIAASIGEVARVVIGIIHGTVRLEFEELTGILLLEDGDGLLLEEGGHGILKGGISTGAGPGVGKAPAPIADKLTAPENFTGTAPEFAVFQALNKLGFEGRFEFQSSKFGGRSTRGGLILDFFIPSLSLGLSVLGGYWHYERGGQQGIDLLQRQQLESSGIRVVFLDEEDVLANAEYFVADALRGIDHSRLVRGF